MCNENDFLDIILNAIEKVQKLGNLNLEQSEILYRSIKKVSNWFYRRPFRGG